MSDMSRRRFLGTSALLLAGGSVMLTGLTSCAHGTFGHSGDTPEIESDAYEINHDSRLAIHTDRVPALAEVGGSVKILDDRLPKHLIVARVGQDTYIAAAIACAHRGVEVEYKPEHKNFHCAAGSSTYDLSGRCVEGPAKQMIEIYNTSLDERDPDVLYVGLLDHYLDPGWRNATING